MIDTLNIGKYVYSTLNNIEGVKSYPIIADNDAKFPFMIYKRTNLNSSGCKDGCYEDTVTIEIDIVTDKYFKGVEIANEVRELLEIPYTEFEGMEINDSKLYYAKEDYIDNAFIQTMQFILKINN